MPCLAKCPARTLSPTGAREAMKCLWPNSTGRSSERTSYGQINSLEHAGRRGFRAMQFNFVVSINDRAVRLWQRQLRHLSGGFQALFYIPPMGMSMYT